MFAPWRPGALTILGYAVLLTACDFEKPDQDDFIPPERECSPIDCSDIENVCGAVSDGCGGTIDCGGCTEPDSCGGGGEENRCGQSAWICSLEYLGDGDCDCGCGAMDQDDCPQPFSYSDCEYSGCAPGTEVDPADPIHCIETSCNANCSGKCAGASDGCGGTCTSNQCSGCCNGSNACLAGNTSTACGRTGNTCLVCSEDDSCEQGACNPIQCADTYEPDNQASEAGLLVPGAPQGHSICPVGDADWWAIELTENSDIVLETSGASGDTVLRLYDSQSNSIGYNDDGGVNNFSKLSMSSLAPGRYYARVTAYSSSVIRDYQMAYTRAQCSPRCAEKCAGEDDGCGGTCQQSSCTTCCSQDGGCLSEVTHSACGDNGSACVPCNESELCSEGRCQGAAAVCGESDFEPDNQSTAAGVLVPEQIQTRAICPANDEDWWSFQLDHHADITIETMGESGDTNLSLYDEAVTLLNTDDSSGVLSFSKLQVRRASPGTYYVRVVEDGSNSMIMSYQIVLTLEQCSEECLGKCTGADNGCGGTCETICEGCCTDELSCLLGDSVGACGSGGASCVICQEQEICLAECLPPAVACNETEYEPDDQSAEAGVLTPGFVQTRGICPASDVDWYRFVLGDYANVTIETTGTAGDTELWLRDAQLETVAYDDNSGPRNFSSINHAGLAAGTYFVEVRSASASQMIISYNISLVIAACTTGCDNACAGAADGCGGICPEDTCDGCCDDNLTCLPGNIATSCGVDAGSCVACDEGTICHLGQCSDPYIACNESTYEPDNDADSANELLVGQPQDRAICFVGDRDWWFFDLGQTSDIVLETSGQSGDTEMALYDSNSNRIAYNDDGGSGAFSKITRSSLSPGRYMVQVYEYHNNGTIASYRISLTTPE